MSSHTLVSIGLPVRNAGPDVAAVVRSVLAQDHERIELVISDNASTDDTQDVCRELAQADDRISYHRQAENIGLLNDFREAMRLGRGEFFRWIGDDDELEPMYVSRCLDVLADPRLILVTTGIAYTSPDRKGESAVYHGTALGSDDPVVRLREMLRLLGRSHLLMDPLYGLMRRDRVIAIPRRNMLREDEVFATKLALAGPWGHVPEVLAHRNWRTDRVGRLARRLDVPSWHAHFASTLQCREMLAYLGQAGLTDAQLSQARRAVYRMYAARQQRTVSHRSRKLLRLATGRQVTP